MDNSLSIASGARNLWNLRSRPATFHNDNDDHGSSDGNGNGDGNGDGNRDHLQLFAPWLFSRDWRFHLYKQ